MNNFEENTNETSRNTAGGQGPNSNSLAETSRQVGQTSSGSRQGGSSLGGNKSGDTTSTPGTTKSASNKSDTRYENDEESDEMKKKNKVEMD